MEMGLCYWGLRRPRAAGHSGCLLYTSPFQHYVQLILSELFQVCLDAYDGENTLHELRLRNKVYPSLMNEFSSWLAAY